METLGFVATVRETVLEAFANQDLAFDTLVEELRPPRDLSRNPVVQVTMALQNTPTPVEGALRIAPLSSGESQTAKFDLSLTVEEREEGLTLAAEYSVDLFTPSTVARLLAHYATLLEGIAMAPDLPLSRLPLLTEAERHQLLAEWNDTAREAAGGPWVHELVAAQARRQPEAPAMVDGARQVSYGMLDLWARRIAYALRGLGVSPEVRVGVCLERSPELLASCLGVLQAGGAYVALDPSHPEERLGFQFEDSGMPVLLTRRGRLAELAAKRGIHCLFPHELDVHGVGEELPTPALAPGNLAYVIYTSGSTGRPKAVDLSHGSLLNLVALQARLQSVQAADRTTLLAGVGYDATILEIWIYLAAGASLYIAPEAVRTSPEELRNWMAQQGITTSFLPTALAEGLLELGWDDTGEPRMSLRSVLTGGDRLHCFVPESLPFRLINAYGPTEATVMATTGPVSAMDRPEWAGQVPTIGRPLENVRVHVLEPGGEPRPAPLGVPGELLIGGAGLARGYLGRPDLTAERFVPDPLAASPGERLYRTGDLVRWSPEGEIEFLGRIDHQVKIRGQRIELGEIEAVLTLHPAVREATVLALDGRLAAFLILGAPVASVELREHARRHLPDHMVPTAFVPVTVWPLSTSGKVDRHTLGEIGRQALAQGGESGAESDTLVTPVQELLAALWRELLEIGHVGLGDNFFDLGGHSLKVAQLRSRVRDAFDLDLPMQCFFEAQTLESQAEVIDLTLRQGGEAGAAIVPVQRDGDPVLSFAQQRLWFLDQLEPGTQLYNIPLVGALEGELDVAALERSFGEIVRRHESLRTTFPETATGAVQKIASPDAVHVPLPVIDASGLPPAVRERELERLTREAVRRPFDLARGPLMRITLLRGGEREHLLLICMHHIISDGWSTGVIVRELSAFYRGFVSGSPVPLPPPPLQYADFAVWQRRWLTGEVLEKQMGYWRRQLSGLSVIELPTDRPRPAVETFRGSLLQVALPPALTGAMRELARNAGGTLYMVLLAAFDVLVASYTGRTDIAVGAAVANRNRRETEDVIGFFVNTLVMRTRLSGDPSMHELLGRVRETTLAAYVHEDLPFERIVEELQPQRDLSRNPLFQVMLVLQNIPLPPLDLPGLSAASLPVNLGTVKFDMALVCWEEEGRLSGQLEYSTTLFDATTMRRLLGHYEAVLARAVANPELPISALAGPTEAERHQFVEEWNDTRIEFGPGRCIHEWVEEQVAATPEALALIAGDVRLTYRELNAMANRLAHHLRRLGIGPDILVGICVDRTWTMVISLLGVLKAGGAALALDPTYPEERLRYVIEDAGLALLLAEEKLLPLLPDTGIPRLRIDTDWSLITAGESDANPVCRTHPESTMYLIYTSGSTGLPKGVSFPHRAFVNLLDWQFGHSRLTRHARTVQFATFGFCVSFLEIFAVLCSGSTLVMVPEEYRRDMEALWKHLEEHEVERLHLPFAALKQLADVCGEENRVPRRLREVVTSGEQLQVGRSIRSLFTNLE
ncbi:MAG TPA: amino acid adenylation domain-containing protein, partial [Thermoanaerobaculia bacterium]|nr:amino acid adenylation domain-containing protein [Thermoanaerobaculia bacterium]